jgi:nitrous oxidase accessory protein NosD
VGGSGPGNYTTIQDAINVSVDGDTVFVYDDSAPYREGLVISHAISLIGEDRQTTVINGSGLNCNIIELEADQVILRGFTLTDADSAGLVIYTNNNTVSDLHITRCKTHGIFLSSNSVNPFRHGNSITNSVIDHTTNGVFCFLGAADMRFAGNVVMDNQNGLLLMDVFSSNFTGNRIGENDNGISTVYCCDNLYTKNLIINNSCGMDIQFSNDRVVKNDFLQNGQQVRFLSAPTFELLGKFSTLRNQSWVYYFQHYRVLGTTRWMGNFWGIPHFLPYPIWGYRGLLRDAIGQHYNQVIFDWHPSFIRITQ